MNLQHPTSTRFALIAALACLFALVGTTASAQDIKAVTS